jgi:putative ABC transport system substrate-binding protein
MAGRRSEVQILRYLLLSILTLLLAIPATATDLLIIQSQRRPAYDQAVLLIQNKCATGAETLVMSDYAEFDLGRLVREEQPRQVIVVGEQALKEARKLRRTPIVYTMALNVDENSLGENITGVTMIASPDNYLKLFRKLQLHRIGIIFDPRRSGAYLKRARQAAAGFGIELVAKEVRSPREVPTALDRLKQSAVDGIWMLPDSTAVSAENVDAYFLFAQQQNLPVFSFARGYLAKGALAVLEVTREKMAEKSCSLLGKLRSGTPAAALPDVDVSEAILHTNESVAAKLEINLSDLKQLFPLNE